MFDVFVTAQLNWTCVIPSKYSKLTLVKGWLAWRNDLILQFQVSLVHVTALCSILTVSKAQMDDKKADSREKVAMEFSEIERNFQWI